MSISFAATPQAKEGQQARAYTDDVSAGAPPSRRTGYDRPYVNRDHWNKVFTNRNTLTPSPSRRAWSRGPRSVSTATTTSTGRR
jgi:hypothetical protein